MGRVDFRSTAGGRQRPNAPILAVLWVRSSTEEPVRAAAAAASQPACPPPTTMTSAPAEAAPAAAERRRVAASQARAAVAVAGAGRRLPAAWPLQTEIFRRALLCAPPARTYTGARDHRGRRSMSGVAMFLCCGVRLAAASSLFNTHHAGRCGLVWGVAAGGGRDSTVGRCCDAQSAGASRISRCTGCRRRGGGRQQLPPTTTGHALSRRAAGRLIAYWRARARHSIA